MRLRAVEAVDKLWCQTVEQPRMQAVYAIITADHGNAEQMLEEDGSPNTAHSLNFVPFII
jgi:2,3-bisphosphoglycerate-independent phosphoglycerate mutase